MPSQANLKKAQKAYLESRSGPKEAREARSRSVEPGTSKAVAKVASKKSSKVGPKKATKSASVGAAVKSEKVKKESKKAKVQEEPIPETDAAEKPKTARLRAGTAIEDPENEVVDSPPKPKKGSKASTKKTDAEMASSTNGNAEEAQDEPTEPAPKDKKGKKAAAKKVEPEPETNGQDEESAETRKGRRSGGKKAETPKEAPKEKKKPANTKKAASVKRGNFISYSHYLINLICKLFKLGATDTELAEHANKKLRVQSEMNTKADPNASMDSEN